LVYARFVKHRSLATNLITEGHVRLNRLRVSKPGHVVKEGDVLTLSLPGQVRVVKVLAAAERRGPSAEAKLLYEDLLPQQSPASENQKISA
jgi:ribosome-associated heat shock protein Hsp15